MKLTAPFVSVQRSIRQNPLDLIGLGTVKDQRHPSGWAIFLAPRIDQFRLGGAGLRRIVESLSANTGFRKIEIADERFL